MTLVPVTLSEYAEDMERSTGEMLGFHIESNHDHLHDASDLKWFWLSIPTTRYVGTMPGCLLCTSLFNYSFTS